MKNTTFPQDHFLDCKPQLLLDPNMCGFWYGGLIPNSSGQLEELIVYIIPLA